MRLPVGLLAEMDRVIKDEERERRRAEARSKSAGSRRR